MVSLAKKQIAYWSEKYDVEEDQYNSSLEKELGEQLRRTKQLTKDELGQIIEWKFQGRLLGRRKHFMNIISDIPDEFIGKVTNESFNEEDERLRIRKLMGRYGGIAGVGFAIASVILTFYDPEKYGVYDIHAWRELFGTKPADLFTNFDNLTRFLGRLRDEAKQTGCNVRTVEKAYFKKNLDEAKAAKPR
jgi:hypothetical protein